MRRVAYLFLIVLMACNGPTPYFRDAPTTRVEVGGSVFDVRVKGQLAEAVRVNTEYAPRFGPIRLRAARAIAQVSQCKVLEVLGDASVATGFLDCPDIPGAAKVPKWSGQYDCFALPQISEDSDYVDYECTPY